MRNVGQWVSDGSRSVSEVDLWVGEGGWVSGSGEQGGRWVWV